MSEPKLRVFVDADVLFAGAASPTEHGASLTILRFAEITLIEAVTCRQAIGEVERSIETKIPRATSLFRVLVERCLRVVDDPLEEELAQHAGEADSTDLPILVAAIRERCPWLVTFNLRHFAPGNPSVRVQRPGEFLTRVRHHLTRLSSL